MAYNNREWDQGKDSWSGASTWHEGTGKGNVRQRDDDFYAEGKRRKFNNGSHDASQNFDATAYEGAAYGHGRQTDTTQEYAHDDRSQRGFKKRLAPSEPSPHVIFLGLDPDFTEADLQAYLTSNGCSIETVTIIRDRSTGIEPIRVSKGFGFAQFTTTEHARAFVDPLFPFIQVPPPASHGASATAAFYKALETSIPNNGRRVKIDFSQSASPHERGRMARQNMNDGTRDIGSASAPILLFRGLDPLSGPQAIAQAMLSSSGPGKPGAKGMKRIILIKDKVTMASFGFAFVEFIDVQSASTVLAATMSSQIHPSGFRISDRPVAASFAHPYSFQPATEFVHRDEACLMSSLSLGGVEDTWVRYWDEAATAAVLEFEVEAAVQTSAPVKEKKERKRVKASDVEAAQRPAAPSALPVSDKPVTLNFSKGPGMSNKPFIAPAGPTPMKSLAPVSLGFSLTDDPAGSDDPSEHPSNTEDSKVAAAKKVAPLIASKKTVNNITKWNQVKEELNMALTAPSSSTLTAPAKTSESIHLTSVPSSMSADASLPKELELEFSNTSAMTCLLCARQFKTLDQLKRHNKESDLHKKNFKDPNLRDVARNKANASRHSADTPTTDQPKYRDRASERRVIYNQPDVPLPEGKDKPGKKKQSEGPPLPPTPPPAPINPGEDHNNVGNKLLKMMGWTEGTGLGTTGEGRVEPIQTAIYAQGAGLGASKGKEIGKYADGYSGYVHMAQDSARERYGS